jgi:hypothetical protein
MTVEEVRDRVASIRSESDDDERAHVHEDRLHQDVLRYLADNGNALAREALTTLDIDFARWCA